MLLPGIMFIFGEVYLFPELKEDIVIKFVNKYVSFLFMSYLYGIIYHEIGKLADDLKGLFIGKFDETYFDKVNKGKKLDFKLINKVKKIVFKECFDNGKMKREYSNKEKNRFVFYYCLTQLEAEGLTGKMEKMLSISEMSRSMYLVCLTLLIQYLIKRRCVGYNLKIIIALIFSMAIFCKRKLRYEEYRADIMIKNYYILYNKKS